jgi:chaperonin GroEL (HSP60 family)
MTRPTSTGRDLWVTHDVERTTDEDALRANLAAATALTSTLRTTLGPRGMDKMLVGRDGTVVVTNDGASILGKMELDDPAARMIRTVASAQAETVGDGTTTAVVLAGDLLDAAGSLLDDGLHPTTIVSGFREALDHARDRLDDYGVPVDVTDDDTLRAVARTAVTGRWDEAQADRFASLAVDGVRAVESDGRVDVGKLTLSAYAGGDLADSTLLDGLFVDTTTSSTSFEAIDHDLPRTVGDARIALVDDELTVQTPDRVGRATVSTADELRRLQRSESDERSRSVETIERLDVDVLFCQKSVDDDLRAALARRGVLVLERTRQDELDALARATGATAVTSARDLDDAALGHAGAVDRREVGTTEAVLVTDLPGESHASLLLRGGTEHVADETRRIVEDCIAVVELAIHEGSVLPGGGAIEVALARDVEAHAPTVEGREQLAVDAFATALEGVPRVLARNAGLDPIDALVDLRARHRAGEHGVGVDATTATAPASVRDLANRGVLEPRGVVDRCLVHAAAAATAILRVDELLDVGGSSGGSGASHDHDHGHADHDHGDHDGYPWAIGH